MKCCNYCKDGAWHIIYSKGIVDPNFMDAWILSLENGYAEDIDKNIVFEVKDNIGYLKINERYDFTNTKNCVNIKVDSCLICGRKLQQGCDTNKESK